MPAQIGAPNDVPPAAHPSARIADCVECPIRRVGMASTKVADSPHARWREHRSIRNVAYCRRSGCHIPASGTMASGTECRSRSPRPQSLDFRMSTRSVRHFRQRSSGKTCPGSYCTNPSSHRSLHAPRRVANQLARAESIPWNLRNVRGDCRVVARPVRRRPVNGILTQERVRVVRSAHSYIVRRRSQRVHIDAVRRLRDWFWSVTSASASPVETKTDMPSNAATW